MKFNDNNNKDMEDNNQKAQNIIEILKQLGKLEYSNYKPEETYRFFEESRGKCSE